VRVWVRGLCVVAALAASAAVAAAAPAEDPSLIEALAVLKAHRFIDLTHAFAPGIPHWKGAPDERVKTLYTVQKDGFRINEYCHIGQWGTHVDPPAHFHTGDTRLNAAVTPLDAARAKHYRWDDMAAEPLKDGLSRRLITSERMMIAHVYLKKGADVPRHSHENEQITYILEGALQFWLGENETQELTVRAGEVLVIPSNLPHRALALEDTLDVDVFNPPRQDWLSGSDAYLRR
jgi:quercetin dioxygenase-like cupin family protein